MLKDLILLILKNQKVKDQKTRFSEGTHPGSSPCSAGLDQQVPCLLLKKKKAGSLPAQISEELSGVCLLNVAQCVCDAFTQLPGLGRSGSSQVATVSVDLPSEAAAEFRRRRLRVRPPTHERQPSLNN